VSVQYISLTSLKYDAGAAFLNSLLWLGYNSGFTETGVSCGNQIIGLTSQQLWSNHPMRVENICIVTHSSR